MTNYTKEELLSAPIRDYKELHGIKGLYVIPNDEEPTVSCQYKCMDIIAELNDKTLVRCGGICEDLHLWVKVGMDITSNGIIHIYGKDLVLSEDSYSMFVYDEEHLIYG